MKRERKNESAITLIALVITIIVLLILAGVTIVTLTGDNGLITKANETRKTSIIGEEKEKIMLGYNEYQVKKYTSSEDNKLDVDGAIVTPRQGDGWDICFNHTTGHEYILLFNGQIYGPIAEESLNYICNEEGTHDVKLGDIFIRSEECTMESGHCTKCNWNGVVAVVGYTANNNGTHTVAYKNGYTEVKNCSGNIGELCSHCGAYKPGYITNNNGTHKYYSSNGNAITSSCNASYGQTCSLCGWYNKAPQNPIEISEIPKKAMKTGFTKNAIDGIELFCENEDISDAQNHSWNRILDEILEKYSDNWAKVNYSLENASELNESQREELLEYFIEKKVMDDYIDQLSKIGISLKINKSEKGYEFYYSML